MSWRLARIRFHKARIRLRQVQAEEVDLLPHTADHRDRFAKIDLPVARRVRQRHEGLAPTRPADADIILYHRIAASKGMLVSQPLEDPLRRMPLLDRPRPVALQDRVDHRQQRAKLGLRCRHLARISRRQRKPAHLQHRLAAQPEYPRRLASAMALDKYETPYRGIVIHAKHSRPPPKGPA